MKEKINLMILYVKINVPQAHNAFVLKMALGGYLGKILMNG